jgi:hypothetical protein
MKPFELFLSGSVGLQRLSQTYLELRQYFQELGWTEEDVKHPPMYTSKLMRLKENFNYEQNVLYRQIMDLGLKVDVREFYDFIQQMIEKINEITPLSDGNNERGNQGNEDY